MGVLISNKMKQSINFDVIETTSIIKRINKQHYYLPMSPQKTQQYRYDIQMWNRIVFHSQEENAHLKIRLAELSTFINNNKDIELLEFHQNNLIKIDSILKIFINEAYQYQTLIEQADTLCVSETVASLDAQHEKLSKEIESIESIFNKNKFQFANFISQMVSKDVSIN